MDSLTKLREVIKIAKENNLKTVKFGDIIIEFQPSIPENKFTNIGESIGSDLEMPSDDEMLHWSTTEFDRIKSERQTGKQPEA